MCILYPGLSISPIGRGVWGIPAGTGRLKEGRIIRQAEQRGARLLCTSNSRGGSGYDLKGVDTIGDERPDKSHQLSKR